ncbi:PQQ-binding-like beta-propeller repeat protein [Longispora sp. NPDC051575]|uniref:outer membrane protein assembly factor BamB family protein n=1 Tax=Longispora sp. NPDC051575 TaxID=3154943 RepID=UPI003426C742
MNVIDLGEITEEPAPEPPRRPLDLGWVRRVPAGLLMAAVIGVGCVAAAGPDPGAPRQILTAVDGYAAESPPALDGDTLYAATATQLTRYDLRHGGRVVYRVPVSHALAPSALRVVDGMLLATVRASSGPGSDATTVAYDPGTGTQRWDHPGIVSHVLPDGRVLFDTGAAVDLATGRELWRDSGPFVLGPDGAPVLPLRTIQVVPRSESTGTSTVVSEHLRLWEPESGRELATRVLYSYSVRRESGDTGGFEVFDTLPVFVVPGGVLLDEKTALVGIDPATLKERWRSPTPLRLFAPSLCGRLVCLDSPTGMSYAPVTAVDPETGTARWQNTFSGAVTTDGSYRRLGSNALVLAPDGTVLEKLTGWRVLDADRRFPDRIPLVRDADAGGYWLGVLDGPTGRVRLVLPLPTSPASCAGNDRHLACVDTGGRLGAWSYGVH